MTVRNLDALLKPQRVAVLGAAGSPGQQQLLRNLADTVAREQRWLVAAEAPGWDSVATISRLPEIDLAVGFDGRRLRPDAIRRLAARGCRALIWATDIPVDGPRLVALHRSGMRVLGARSPGVANVRGGINASAFALAHRPGRLALITQSRTLAAAALDWAAGRGIGFSWLAVTGAEADIDIADLLDYAALDPDTEAVVVQLAHISGARKFMSAARALARAKPVAILQTRAADVPGSGPDPVRSAAFRRAGLVECDTLGSLFDAIAALERLPRQSEPRLAVIGNGAAVVGLGVDALQREGLAPAELPAALRKHLRRHWPLARTLSGALDLGSTAPVDVARAVGEVLASGAIDAVLLVYSPGPGEAHDAVAEALIEARAGARVLTVWLGLATARQARQRCAEAGIPTFASTGDAARALRYRQRHRQTQQLLSQTPPVIAGLAADRQTISAEIAALAKTADGLAADDQALRWLAAYGIGRPAAGKRGPGVIASLRRHPELGSHLVIHADVAGLRVAEAFAFPPLDGLLARRLLEDAGFIWHEAGGPRDHARLALALIRFAQFAIEQPLVAEIRLRITAAAGGARCTIDSARLRVEAKSLPEPARLALAPYPAQLSHGAALRGGRTVRVRAIRPEDEPQLIRMLEHTDPEAIRLRFFAAIRYFSHAMAARLSQIDYDRELVLIAIPPDAGDDGAQVVALAHLSSDPDRSRAEYALLVQQTHARLGLGRHMLLQLLDYAAQRGIGRVYGEVLADNDAMLGLCARLGFTIRRSDSDPGCLHVEIDPAQVRSAEPA